ncbi:MAG: prepilin-type N-terminal cleavage/methylation domain-containing protein [Phycisphaeraceae bacterium]
MNASRAFTLLELLLATAISAMLMVGVLSVITTLGADSVGPAESRNQRVSRDEILHRWTQLLRHDLGHARTIEPPVENTITLLGYAALTGPARDRVHRPVEVVYELASQAGRSWVVRRQRALDTLTNRVTERDLVCGGVRAFRLTHTEKQWRVQVWLDEDPQPVQHTIMVERGVTP